MQEILFLTLIVSFFLTLIVLPIWIRKCRQVDLLWEDMNKYNRPKNVAASGGVVVVMSFVLSLLFYVAIRTFIMKDADGITIKIFGLLAVILLLSIVGLVDDLLGWKHGGLSRKMRLFLAFPAAIPLMVINAGASTLSIPFIGIVDIGLLYPLIFIPIGIVGATTTYNFLAGFNGLEAGQGIIVLSFMAFIAYITNNNGISNSWLALVCLMMVASLIVFYFYNKYPAKVFPGDILTWSIGALIACVAILGNFERIALFIFIPYIIETILKIRGGLVKQSFGTPAKDGSLQMPYEKIYGLTHASIWILSKFKTKVYEKDVTYLIFSFQIIICLISLIVFRSVLFI
jgi:UDP-N-acetylglucosamine--dolichyl-phosphate N-acetylglucosaminephosphotransferase